MNAPSNDPTPQPEPVKESIADALKTDAAPPLNDEALAQQQEQYRQAYIEQLRRMICPGCGDDGVLPF
jgi:hypothetical protein